jgi:flagella basal body P-ring formation protein FlgA
MHLAFQVPNAPLTTNRRAMKKKHHQSDLASLNEASPKPPPEWRRHKGFRWLLVLPACVTFGYSPQTTASVSLHDQLIGATRGFLEQAVNNYLQRSNIQARHEIQINRLDPRLRLPICDKVLTVSLEAPAEPVGRVTTRVRCDGNLPWTIFMPGYVRLYRDVVTLTRPVSRDSILVEQDVALAERDVGRLSQGYITDLNQAIGRKVTRVMQPDQVLAPVHVQSAETIRRGDQVIISARGGGINVRMPGEALSDGVIGKQIRVRNQRSQRVVRARVTGPGHVEVSM